MKGKYKVVRNADGWAIYGGFRDSALIAQVFDEWNEPDRTATAHLLAAAPCLLEALKNLEAAFQSHTQWNGEPLNEIKTARAAILKATGEKQ